MAILLRSPQLRTRIDSAIVGIDEKTIMLVILTDEQILSTQQVCQSCLLADRRGLPRWHQGKLSCGHCLSKAGSDRPALYECQMGFVLASID